MNDFHNLHNAAEVQRLQEEHPGEDDLIVYHRTNVGKMQFTLSDIGAPDTLIGRRKPS